MTCNLEFRELRKRCPASASSGVPTVRCAAVRAGALTSLLAASLDLLLLFSAMLGLALLFIEEAGPIFWISNEVAFALGGSSFSLDIYPGSEPAFLWHATLLLVCWLGLASLSKLTLLRRKPRGEEAA